MNEPSAMERACSAAGSAAKLARLLSVTPAAVHQWKTGDRPVPAERCPDIERVTGGKVRCEDLRPDVRWDVLRTQESLPAANEAAADVQEVANG